MKRAGGLWEKLISFENLQQASRRAALGKKKRPDVAAFLMEQETELVRLRGRLESGEYRPGAYRQFRADDPKPRLISAAPFRDRVVHHALTQVLEPVFERRFSKDSFAYRKGFGTQSAGTGEGSGRSVSVPPEVRRPRGYLRLRITRSAIQTAPVAPACEPSAL